MEVLIAVALIAAVIVSVTQFVSRTNTLSREGEKRVVALGLAEESMEAARSVRNTSFDTLKAYANGNYYRPVIQSDSWTFQSGSETVNGFYTRRVTMRSVCRVSATGSVDNNDISTNPDDDTTCSEAGVTTDNNTIKVVSEVSWPIPPGERSTWPHQIVLVTYLTDSR